MGWGDKCELGDGNYWDGVKNVSREIGTVGNGAGSLKLKSGIQ